MAIIWGFDLSQMSWGAFRHKKMFAKGWYLRKERFTIYQIAMLTALTAECTATYSLSKYKSLKHNVHFQSTVFSPLSAALVDQNALISAAVSTIVFCVLVATLFGADFFFLVFWPARRYPRWYVSIKELLAVIISAGMGASAIVSTWVIASQQAVVTGVDQATATRLLQIYTRPPLVYRHWAQNIVWVVLLWVAFISTVASTFLMFLCAQHDARFGPHNNASKGPEADEKGLSTDTEENAPITRRAAGVASASDSIPIKGADTRDRTQDIPNNDVNANLSHSNEDANAIRVAQGGSGNPTMALKHVRLPLRADNDI